VTDEANAQRVIAAAENEEALKARLEREHGELFEELRALIPGAEVLFGLLLATRFTAEFEALTQPQRIVYYVTLLATAVALVLFLAPSAYHRLRFRAGDKEYLLRKGNREAILGSVAISVAITGVIELVTDLVFGTGPAIAVAVVFFVFIAWRWWAIALYRSAMDKRSDESRRDDSRPA
jgi:hypothetical protein